jgi:hypothetical protein
MKMINLNRINNPNIFKKIIFIILLIKKLINKMIMIMKIMRINSKIFTIFMRKKALLQNMKKKKKI